MSVPPPVFMGDMDQFRRDQERYRAEQERFKNQPPLDLLGSFLGTGQQPLMEVNRGYGEGIGNLQQGRMGPLSGLGQYINQELAQDNQGEVDEFIGEVGDMANQRFGVDLGSVGQRPMFMAGGGAAFPDLSGDGKITQKDILMGRGVIGMEEGGVPFVEYEQPIDSALGTFDNLPERRIERGLIETMGETRFFKLPIETQISLLSSMGNSARDIATFFRLKKMAPELSTQQIGFEERKRLDDLTRSGDFREGPVKGMLPPSDDPRMEKYGPQERTMQSERFRENKTDGERRVVKGMQMGGDPMTAPPMPMPAPEQAPMPMEDQLDPNVVQQALSQAAGGIASLDEAQNYEDVMNSMRGNQASVEERRQELAGVVGPGDAGQTPESVLTLVQPVMMLANVDQGVGGLAQEQMTQPMEGPMAEGIMSTVPEPPMEADGTVPVNFKYGGEVRPVQYFAPGGVAGTNPFASLAGTELSPFVQQAYKARQALLADPADLQRQKDLTKAQMLFDIAGTAAAYAAPMEGEPAGLSAAERLAFVLNKTKLPQTIGARAQALGDKEAAQKAQDKAIMASAITSGEQRLAAKKAAEAAAGLQKMKGEQSLVELNLKNAQEISKINLESKLDIIKQRLKTGQETAGKLSVEELKAVNQKALEVVKSENAQALATLKADKDFESKTALQIQANDLEKQNMKLDNLLKRGRIRLDADMTAKKLGLEHTNDLELQEKNELHAVNMAIRSQAYARELKRIDTRIKEKELELKTTQGNEKIQIERELLELKQEEFDYEKLQKGLIDYSLSQKQSFVKFLTGSGPNNGVALANKYRLGQTTEGENNAIHFVINNHTKETVSLVDGVTIPAGLLSPEWENAIKGRQALNEGRDAANKLTLPNEYLGITPSQEKKPTEKEQPTETKTIFRPGYTFSASDINATTFDTIISELNNVKSATGITGAFQNAVNTASEYINFIVDKPFKETAKAIDLMDSLNSLTTVIYMDAVKGKASEELRREFKATLPNFAEIRKGESSVYNKVRGTIATLNNVLEPLLIEQENPLRTTDVGALKGKIGRLQDMVKAYAKIGEKLQSGGMQPKIDNRPPLGSFHKNIIK